METRAAQNGENRDKANAFDLLTTAVVALDEQLTVRAINTAAEDLFGVSAQRALGARLPELLSDDGAEGHARIFELFETREPVTRRAAEFRLRDASTIKVDFSLSFDPISGACIVELRPLDRLLRINRDDHALASMKTAQELALGLAHEIKNPLGGLRGAAQLLDRQLPDPDLREYTAVIISEADRLKELVDRMLGPNRQPRLAACNIHQVLEHVVRLVEAEFPASLEIVRDYDPSLPELTGDEDRLIQAMLNVVRNAAQSTLENPAPAGRPEIHLKSRVVRSYTIGKSHHKLAVQIDITDNGPGISEDMLDRIFFPMISTRADGTGLGLAITRNIVGQHHGVIECHSQPGRTCFSVFFPLEAQDDD